MVIYDNCTIGLLDDTSVILFDTGFTTAHAKEHCVGTINFRTGMVYLLSRNQHHYMHTRN